MQGPLWQGKREEVGAVSDLGALLLPTSQVTLANPSRSVLPIHGCKKGLSPFLQDVSVCGV